MLRSHRWFLELSTAVLCTTLLYKFQLRVNVYVHRNFQHFLNQNQHLVHVYSSLILYILSCHLCRSQRMYSLREYTEYWFFTEWRPCILEVVQKREHKYTHIQAPAPVQSFQNTQTLNTHAHKFHSWIWYRQETYVVRGEHIICIEQCL